jgi:RNA polymerase sigma-70 factor (ECF subfamily)
MPAESNNPNPTQTRLLRDVRDSRNQGAWADFHRIYVPLITSFLRRMGLNDADVDDAVQEILLVAQDALRSGKYDRSKGGFRAWLYGVARNKALTTHRNRRRPSRAQSVETESGVDLLSGIEDRHEDTDRSIWEQEYRYALLAEAMRNVKTTMADKVFEAFVRHAVHRQPVEEVAEALGLSPSSVYVYKQRALEAIKGWVKEHEKDEGGELS